MQLRSLSHKGAHSASLSEEKKHKAQHSGQKAFRVEHSVWYWGWGLEAVIVLFLVLFWGGAVSKPSYLSSNIVCIECIDLNLCKPSRPHTLAGE